MINLHPIETGKYSTGGGSLVWRCKHLFSGKVICFFFLGVFFLEISKDVT